MAYVKDTVREKWDQTKDWLRDRFRAPDPLYRHPAKAIRLYAEGSEGMSPEIRAQRHNDLKAQVSYYYSKNKRDVPEKIVHQLAVIEKDYKRLETMDKARAVLQQHGPITKATIQRDLEASKDYRIQAGIDKPTPVKQHQIEFTPLKVHIAAHEPPVKEDTRPLRAHNIDEAKPIGKVNRKEKVQEHVAEI